MADSKRQLIMNAIKARLQGITIANGYETDLGNFIFEWRIAPYQSIDLPGADLRDTIETVDNTIDIHIHNMTVDVNIIGGTATLPLAIRWYMADVMKAVSIDLTWGGLAEDTVLAGNDMIEREIEIDSAPPAKVTGAVVKLNVAYTTAPFDPYG